jgi:hypothetical protein
LRSGGGAHEQQGGNDFGLHGLLIKNYIS